MQNNNVFEEIIAYIYKYCGLNCRQYNDAYIKRRFNARILARRLQKEDYKSYLEILKHNPEEARILFETLTVNVTEFFRDMKLWETLKDDVFLKIINEKRKNNDKIMLIWSCGCSAGEEPYSIAMILKEMIKDKDITVSIIATDIDDKSLKQAKSGTYSKNSLANMPKEYLIKYFVPVTVDKEEKYELTDDIKRSVHFYKQNILRDPPPGRSFDMIFCRNVIIYFTQKTKEALIMTFSNYLRNHGWLVLGKSEVIFTSSILQYEYYVYNSGERIYRKERRIKKDSTQNEKRENWWMGYLEELGRDTEK